MKAKLSILLICSLFCLACPKQNIDTAKAQSAKLARYAGAGVYLTGELFRNKVLTLGQKDKIADGFIFLAKAGQTFDAAIAELEKKYDGKTVPKAELKDLFAVFNAEVVAKFLDLLRTLKVSVHPDLADVIEAIRTAVLIVAGLFGKKLEVRQQIEAI